MSTSLEVFLIVGAVILLSFAAIAILINRRRKRVKQVSEGNVPERKKWETPEVLGITVSILALVSSTAIGVTQLVNGQLVSNLGTNGSAHVNYVDQNIPVEGRAASPSDIRARGIRITDPRGHITFQNLQGISKTITFREWNTIVATSKVPKDVELAIDPHLNINSATSVRRTQYLADLMGMQDGEVQLGPIEYLRLNSGKDVGAPVLIVNGRSTAVRVTGVHLIVWNDRKSKKYLDVHFAFGPQPLFVAAKTSLFTALFLNAKTPASFASANWATQANVHYQPS